MKIFFYIFIVLQLIIAFYLLQPVILLMIHFVKKIFIPYKSPVNKKPKIKRDFDFATIITAHEDARFIHPLVDSLLKQNYPNFHIYVVADACDISQLHFEDDKVDLLKPEHDFHVKIKSIQYAVDNFVREHDVLIIFDSDNLVHPDYLMVLNKYFQQGYLAVQTQMLSKNISTVYSRLDSIGHVYHTFLERKMRMELGLSAHILGLGIAIETKLYKQIMYKDRLGGFDKKLQADIVKNISKLAYSEEAIVYDEKVDDGKTLEKQRTRWLFTYFHYFKANWDLFITGIKRCNFNIVYFGLIVLRPPLFLVIAMGFLLGLINILIDPIYSIAWAGILFLYVLSFVVIVITQSQQKGVAKALLFIPVFVFRQLKALLKIKQAGKSFLKTEHTKVLYIEDILNEA